MFDVEICPAIAIAQLEKLFSVSWDEPIICDFEQRHRVSLAYVVAFCESAIVGYLNIAHDGCRHAFIVDVTVRPDMRRQGIASEMLKVANTLCKSKGYEWVHLDFEDHLEPLYRGAGFSIGKSGTINF